MSDQCVKLRIKVAKSEENIADLKDQIKDATGALLHGLARQLTQALNQLAREKEALADCEKTPPPPPGTVHVIVFSNFEGFQLNREQAQRVIDWFDACSAAHPEARWTHLYDPRHLLVDEPRFNEGAEIFDPYLLDLQSSGIAEIGIHMHMYYDLVRTMGVDPIDNPTGNDSSTACDAHDADGYGVLLTGYSSAARSAILDAATMAFLSSGFQQPRTFCAGYSAADPVLQSLLVSKGFTTSFAAQPLTRLTPTPPNYPSCWLRWLNWSEGHITPLTIPYKVNRYSILPPPHDNEEYLELVEVPLNMWVDAYDLYRGSERVSRNDMFDLHYDWARETANQTAVAIGVHAEAVSDEAETWGSDDGSEVIRIWKVIDGFLKHVEERAGEGSVEIRYETASEVAEYFRDNKTIGFVGG